MEKIIKEITAYCEEWINIHSEYNEFAYMLVSDVDELWYTEESSDIKEIIKRAILDESDFPPWFDVKDWRLESYIEEALRPRIEDIYEMFIHHYKKHPKKNFDCADCKMSTGGSSCDVCSKRSIKFCNECLQFSCKKCHCRCCTCQKCKSASDLIKKAHETPLPDEDDGENYTFSEAYC